ncbi:MAG: type II secretion system protein [Candidatus Gastranaerophilaceae bacterium]
MYWVKRLRLRGGGKNLKLLSLFNGFTLAEVLITLGIIGIVAALTLPSVITKYEKQKTVEGVKTAYSIFSQALNRSVAENGDFDNWDYSLTPVEFCKKYIIPYMQVIKVCEDTKCIKTDNFYGFYSLAKVRCDGYPISWVLPNGMVFIYTGSDNLAFKTFAVDINGSKGKNTMGRDVFSFFLHTIATVPSIFPNNRKIPTKLYLGSYQSGGGPHERIEIDKLFNQVSRACGVFMMDGKEAGGTSVF